MRAAIPGLLLMAAGCLAAPMNSGMTICNQPPCKTTYKSVAAFWSRAEGVIPYTPHFPEQQLKLSHSTAQGSTNAKATFEALSTTPSSLIEAMRVEEAALLESSPLSTMAHSCHRVASATTTYVYGFSYNHRDHADLFVVAIVFLFLIAIVAMELFESVAGLLPGVIRLEEETAVVSDALPAYSMDGQEVCMERQELCVHDVLEKQ